MPRKCIHTGGDVALSEDESRFAEENHGLLLKFMANYHLGEEHHGRLAVRYLASVRRYLNDPALRERYRFSTILWYDLRSEISHMLRGDTPESLNIDEVNGLSVDDDLSGMDIDAFWSRAERVLTRRQLEVLRLRCEGLTYTEIAQLCGITGKAVACRMARLRSKIEKLKGQ